MGLKPFRPLDIANDAELLPHLLDNLEVDLTRWVLERS
jgi:hypothetical protein